MNLAELHVDIARQLELAEVKAAAFGHVELDCQPALLELQRHLKLEAAYLLTSSAERPEKFKMHSLTTEKATPFRNVNWDCEQGHFVNDLSSRVYIQWEPLQRLKYRRDSLWELLWQSMILGPYSGPWEIAAIVLRKKPNDDFVGLLALVRDSGEDHPLVEDFPNVLKLLANQFYTAERWHTFQTLLTTERQQSASEHFKAILTRAKADFAHGAFAKLQRVGLQVHNARRELRRGNQPTVTSALDTIDGLKEEITRLIKDVLSAEIAPASNSSRQAGRPASSAEWVRVPDSIDMFANSLGGLATVAKKTIIPRVDPPSTFPINKMDFDEILSNLIHNAIKYSVEFSKIKISLHHTTRRTMLDITSYGIEISPQDREQIFERGYRTDLAAMIAFNALGIGLSQARRLAENAGASLFVLASEELGKDSLTPTIRIHGKEYPAFRNTFRLTSHR